MAPLHKAAELSPDLIKRLRKVEQKHRDQERRDELEFIENGPHYIGFDCDAAIEEFKRGREIDLGTAKSERIMCQSPGVSGGNRNAAFRCWAWPMLYRGKPKAPKP